MESTSDKAKKGRSGVHQMNVMIPFIKIIFIKHSKSEAQMPDGHVGMEKRSALMKGGKFDNNQLQ